MIFLDLQVLQRPKRLAVSAEEEEVSMEARDLMGEVVIIIIITITTTTTIIIITINRLPGTRRS